MENNKYYWFKHEFDKNHIYINTKGQENAINYLNKTCNVKVNDLERLSDEEINQKYNLNKIHDKTNFYLNLFLIDRKTNMIFYGNTKNLLKEKPNNIDEVKKCMCGMPVFNIDKNYYKELKIKKPSIERKKIRKK